MANVKQIIADNLARVLERMAQAADATGREAGSVQLVAVTKYVGPAEAAALLEAGHPILGESRPQELWSKAASGSLADARWHLIGHLQRNKVRRTLPYVALVHSIDSERLLSAVDDWAENNGTTADVLLEVNCSGDDSKHGLSHDAARRIVARLDDWPNVHAAGLMTMASRLGGQDAARRDFAALRELRGLLQNLCPADVRLDELSMGMSGDFEEAIAEGATLVRVGSALFEGIPR